MLGLTIKGKNEAKEKEWTVKTSDNPNSRCTAGIAPRGRFQKARRGDVEKDGGGENGDAKERTELAERQRVG